VRKIRKNTYPARQNIDLMLPRLEQRIDNKTTEIALPTGHRDNGHFACKDLADIIVEFRKCRKKKKVKTWKRNLKT